MLYHPGRRTVVSKWRRIWFKSGLSIKDTLANQKLVEKWKRLNNSNGAAQEGTRVWSGNKFQLNITREFNQRQEKTTWRLFSTVWWESRCALIRCKCKVLLKRLKLALFWLHLPFTRCWSGDAVAKTNIGHKRCRKTLVFCLHKNSSVEFSVNLQPGFHSHPRFFPKKCWRWLIKCSTGFHYCLKGRMHSLSLRSKIIFSSAVCCCCVTPSQAFLSRCPEPCQKLSGPAPQLLSSQFPFHLSSPRLFRFSPSVCTNLLKHHLCVAGKCATAGESLDIFLIVSTAKNALQEFVDIMSGSDTVSKVSLGERKLPRGTAFDWCRPFLLLCDVFTDAVADGVRYTHRSWSGEQLARVPQPRVGFTLVSDHVFPLCYEIRVHFILGLPEYG